MEIVFPKTTGGNAGAVMKSIRTAHHQTLYKSIGKIGIDQFTWRGIDNSPFHFPGVREEAGSD